MEHCYPKDKSEPLLIDLKDKSELLFRGAKLGTIVLHVKEGRKTMTEQVHKRLTVEEVKKSSRAISTKR